MGEESADEIRTHDKALVDQAIATLMWHFDSVHIFVSRVEAGHTLGFSNGDGNWYSRFGQVQEWLNNGGQMHAGCCELDDEDEDGD